MYKFFLYYYFKYHLNKVGLKDWDILFRDAKYFGGCAIYDEKIIQINNLWINRGSFKEVCDIFWHEVAHALVGIEHDHDEIWKKVCIALGGNGLKFSKPKIKEKDYNWISYCKCGFSKYYFRKTLVHCPDCGNGVKYEEN